MMPYIWQVTTHDVPLRPDGLTRVPSKAPTSRCRIFDPTSRGAITVPMPLSETMQTQKSILLIRAIVATWFGWCLLFPRDNERSPRRRDAFPRPVDLSIVGQACRLPLQRANPQPTPRLDSWSFSPIRLFCEFSRFLTLPEALSLIARGNLSQARASKPRKLRPPPVILI